MREIVIETKPDISIIVNNEIASNRINSCDSQCIATATTAAGYGCDEQCHVVEFRRRRHGDALVGDGLDNIGLCAVQARDFACNAHLKPP